MSNKTASSASQESNSTTENLTDFLERFIRFLARASEDQSAVTPTDAHMERLKDVLAALARSPRMPARAPQREPVQHDAGDLAAAPRIDLEAARILGTASQLEELADALWAFQSEAECISRALYSAKALRKIVMDTAARNQPGE